MAKSTDTSETCATFEHGGFIYEVDDLGSGEHPHQAGAYAVYLDGEEVAQFHDLGYGEPSYADGSTAIDDPLLVAAFAAVTR